MATSRISIARERIGRAAWRLTGPRVFWIVLPLYILALMLLRGGLMPVASQDDAEQLILAQSLAGGYGPAQPPLYTWLVWLTGQIVGPGLLAVLIVKYVCLYLLFAFLAAAASVILPGSDQARLVPLGLLGLFYVGYEAVFNYSNTLAQAAATAATIWALARLHRRHPGRDRWGAYAALGIAIGLGLLSKYGYALFLGATVAAMLTVGSFRRILFARGIWLSLAIAVAIVLPHAIWLVAGGADLVGGFGQRLAAAPTADYGAIAAKGLFKLVNGLLVFLFPLILAALILFPRAALPLPPGADAERDFIRLGNRFFLFVVAALVFAVLVLRVPNVRTHYMFVLIGFPLWWLLRARALDLPMRRFRQFATVLVAFGVVWPAVVAVRWGIEPMVQKRPYFHFPYARLATDLRATGYTGRGTIVAHFDLVQIGGNLKAQFPGASVASTKYPFYRPPGAGQGPCLLVWRSSAGATPPKSLLAFSKRLGIVPPANARQGTVSAPIPRGRGRKMSLAYILLPETTGTCR